MSSIETFRVFDRWGGMVFESPSAILPNEPRLGWNGVTDGQPVNAGVYVYYFQVRFINGELVEYAGDVAVLR